MQIPLNIMRKQIKTSDMWILLIIGAAVVYMLVKFFSDTTEQHNTLKREGGIRRKYSVLINQLSQGPGVEIFQDDTNCVSVGVNNAAGADYFVVMQTFDTVTIQHIVKNNPVFGSFKKEYTFPKDMDQKLMVSRIVEDIRRTIERGY